MKNLNQIGAASLAALIVMLAPGFGCYQALAMEMDGRAPIELLETPEMATDPAAANVGAGPIINSGDSNLTGPDIKTEQTIEVGAAGAMLQQAISEKFAQDGSGALKEAEGSGDDKLPGAAPAASLGAHDTKGAPTAAMAGVEKKVAGANEALVSGDAVAAANETARIYVGDGDAAPGEKELVRAGADGKIYVGADAQDTGAGRTIHLYNADGGLVKTLVDGKEVPPPVRVGPDKSIYVTDAAPEAKAAGPGRNINVYDTRGNVIKTVLNVEVVPPAASANPAPGYYEELTAVLDDPIIALADGLETIFTKNVKPVWDSVRDIRGGFPLSPAVRSRIWQERSADSPAKVNDAAVGADGRIYDVDPVTHEIKISNVDGSPVKTVGTENRVQIFNLDGTYSHTIGAAQPVEGKKNITVGKDGRIYVADDHGKGSNPNFPVYIYDAQLRFVRIVDENAKIPDLISRNYDYNRGMIGRRRSGPRVEIIPAAVDGEKLYLANDYYDARIDVWTDKKLRNVLRMDSAATAILPGSDGTAFIATYWGGIFRYDFKSSRTLHKIASSASPGLVTSMAQSHDRTTLYTMMGFSEVGKIDLNSPGKKPQIFKLPAGIGRYSRHAPILTHDDKHLILLSNDGQVAILGADDGRLEYNQLAGRVTIWDDVSMSLSPDDKTLTIHKVGEVDKAIDLTKVLGAPKPAPAAQNVAENAKIPDVIRKSYVRWHGSFYGKRLVIVPAMLDGEQRYFVNNNYDHKIEIWNGSEIVQTLKLDVHQRGIMAGPVTTMLPGPNGTVFVTTYHSGLYQYDLKSEEVIKRLMPKDVHNVLATALSHDEQTVYVIGVEGVSKIDIASRAQSFIKTKTPISDKVQSAQLSVDDKFLFLFDAGGDPVSIIDTSAAK